MFLIFFVCLFVRSFVHPFIHSFIHSFILQFCTHLLVYSFTPSLTAHTHTRMYIILNNEFCHFTYHEYLDIHNPFVSKLSSHIPQVPSTQDTQVPVIWCVFQEILFLAQGVQMSFNMRAYAETKRLGPHQFQLFPSDGRMHGGKKGKSNKVLI